MQVLAACLARQRSCYIAMQLIESDAVALDGICREYGVKLLILRSYGLLGYIRASQTQPSVAKAGRYVAYWCICILCILHIATCIQSTRCLQKLIAAGFF